MQTAFLRHTALLAVLVPLLPAGTPASAQTIWSAGTGDWNNPANWNNGVPTAGVDAFMENGGTALLTARPGASGDCGSAAPPAQATSSSTVPPST